MAQLGLDALAGPPVIFDLSVPANCLEPAKKLLLRQPAAIQAVFAVSSCVAVAALSHYLIETPFLSLKTALDSARMPPRPSRKTCRPVRLAMASLQEAAPELEGAAGYNYTIVHARPPRRSTSIRGQTRRRGSRFRGCRSRHLTRSQGCPSSRKRTGRISILRNRTNSPLGTEVE